MEPGSKRDLREEFRDCNQAKTGKSRSWGSVEVRMVVAGERRANLIRMVRTRMIT